jgi:hypothetical protein
VGSGTFTGIIGDLGLEKVRVFRGSWGGSLLPLAFALLFFLGSLQLLDALGVVYYPMIHMATRAVRFELGFSLVLPLVLLLVLQMVEWSLMFV